MTYITNQCSEEPILKIIEQMEETTPVDDIEDVTEFINFTKVFINGDWMFVTKESKKVYEDLLYSRRTGLINIYISISFNTDMNEINIFTDAGRCCRPLYIVQNNKLVITKKDIRNLEKNHYDFRNLLLKVLK